MEPPIWHVGAWTGLAWRRLWALLRVAWKDRPVMALFLALLVVDLAAILWFGYSKLLYNMEINKKLYRLREWRIVEEGSYPEMFNYAKTLAVVLLLGIVAARGRQWIYWSFTILFAVVLVDDSLAIHEAWGKFFITKYGIEDGFGLRAQDIGELITWSIFGAILVPLLLVGLLRSGQKHVENGMALMFLFACLLFCAIVVDQLYHSWHDVFTNAGILLDMIEDGGEMLVMTTMFAVTAALVRHGPEVEPA